MCHAGVGTLEMTTGRVSHQKINPIKGQIIYRPSIGPVCRSWVDQVQALEKMKLDEEAWGEIGRDRHCALD